MESTVEAVVDLLRRALQEPERRSEVGQDAAALWWRLDGEGRTSTGELPVWEEALLGLAAWHIDDDRLRLQRAGDEELIDLLDRLTAS